MQEKKSLKVKTNNLDSNIMQENGQPSMQERRERINNLNAREEIIKS